MFNSFATIRQHLHGRLHQTFAVTLAFAISFNAQASERAQQAWQLLHDGAVLIDVRTVPEYQDKHLAGAIHIALQDFPQTDFTIFDKTDVIVLYCRSGNRSGQALQYLSAQGFTRLHNGGGLEEMLLVKPDSPN